MCVVPCATPSAWGYGYLIACSTGSSDWPPWEIHPNGDEIVMLLSTARMHTESLMLFITAGEGTRGRPA